jgi:triphosphatase
MSIETELKLFISPEHLQRLKRHPVLKSLAAGRASTRRLYSVYYDTPALDLRRHAMALRLRRAGRQWLQTLKGGGGVQAGLHQRNEWETAVTGEALDMEVLEAHGGRLPKGVRRQLRPVFVTDFSRTLYRLHFEGAEIELCLDSGEIRAGEKVRPISELELELKSGDPQQLFKLALALLDVASLELEHTSKAEYGYRLYSGDQPAVRKVSFPALQQVPDIPAALQSMIAACLLHVQANVPGTIEGRDEEFLHQVRVGLRRLRVVLAMAEAWRADAELEALHQEVAQMCIEFGRLREWDVFVLQTLLPVTARFPQSAELRGLLASSEQWRARQRAAVVSRLQSPDYQRLLLRFGAWMYGAYWRQAQAGAALRDFAVHILQKRCKQVGKRGRRIAAADAAQLHLLRIACKKLRYSTEMFGSLFVAARIRRYTAALSELQDILGLLNDIAVAQRLLGEVDQAQAAALVRGWLEHERAEQMARLGAAWKRFASRKPPWK